MQINTSLLPWRFNTQRWRTRMNDDADALLEQHGEAAYAIAADKAWRQDVGLLTAPDQGHWSRVTLEIGRRLAIAEPTLPTPVLH